MKVLMILAALIILAAAAVFFEIYREVHHFRITRYEIKSSRLSGLRRETKILFLSDLHNRVYGYGNRDLLQAVRDEKPDLILIGGDMLIGKENTPFDTALDFVRQLPSVCRVFYVNGNHEGRMKEYSEIYNGAYKKYRCSLKKAGVVFLENEICDINLNGQKLSVCGLELPVCTYRKFHKSDINAGIITEYLGRFPEKDRSKTDPESKQNSCYTILLAHNPAYMDAYLDWGADLILSGHLHGGLVRIPGIGGIVTPQGFFFPKYSGEMTREGGQTVIVSRGLGSHTLNIRLFNTPELISITLVPE